jgi:hypothetical protein
MLKRPSKKQQESLADPYLADPYSDPIFPAP